MCLDSLKYLQMYREQEASALITSSSLIERTSQSELRGISQGYLKAAGGLQRPSMCQDGVQDDIDLDQREEN